MTRPERREASANVRRARQLLAGGATLGHAAALIVVGVLFFVRGPAGALSGAISALAVLAFFGLGQLVQILVADSSPQVVMAAALGSYAFRVGLPAIALIAIGSNPERLAGMDRVSVAVAAISVVLAWLAGEIWAFSRLRIPIFDPPESDPR